jgi:hypothetical protein
VLRLYSQDRRRERYLIIYIWKISQGLVEGYDIPFTPLDTRTGRKAVPAKGSSCSTQLRNSDHGDVDMFKNHLGIYLSNILDQPTVAALSRGAQSNSLLHQVPLYEHSS